MNENLRPVYERTLIVLHADPRVLAAFMTGSVGTGREDAYSDADPLFLVRPECFDEVDRDLPAVFAQAGVDPFLWWPERVNCDTLRNYAVLFEVSGKPVQYDITIEAAPAGQTWTIRPDQFIFDKAGVLRTTPTAEQSAHTPKRLRWHVEIYWIYAYIHAKYLRRGNPFRLAAAQSELLQAHVTILHALHPDAAPDWWPILASQFGEPEEREALLAYFGPADAAGIAASLPGQMDRFSRHARAACLKWGIEYPQAAEAGIRAYVETVAASVRGGAG